MHRARIAIFLMLFFSVLGLSVQAQSNEAAQTTTMTPTEQSAAAELFQAANQDRADNNLPPLRHGSALTQAAEKHAQIMVQSGTLSHQLPGEPDLIARVQQAGVHCSTVAENVASGPTADRINDEWMHSASHRANLLDPRVNAIGIAVIDQHGKLFAVQDFALEMTAMTRSQQERQVASLLTAKRLQVESDNAPARAYCKGTPASTQPLPKLVMKYSTTDLTHLPQQVEQGIAGGRYHRAAVGACGTAVQNGFAAYQMVILLY